MTIYNDIFFPECGAAYPPTLFGQTYQTYPQGIYGTKSVSVKTKEIVTSEKGDGNEGESPDEGKQLRRLVKAMRKSAKEREKQSQTRRNIDNERKHKDGLVKSKNGSRGKSVYQGSKTKKHQRSNKRTRPKTRMNTRSDQEFGEGQELDTNARVQEGKGNKERLEYPFLVSVQCWEIHLLWAKRNRFLQITDAS